MRKFRSKTDSGVVIEAAVWAVNGDHPRDDCRVITDPENGELFLSEGAVVRRFRVPDMAGDDICEQCRATLHDHGWIDSENTLESDGLRVCPGDVVSNTVGSRIYTVIPASVFSRKWELVVEAEADPTTEDLVEVPMFNQRAREEMERSQRAEEVAKLSDAAEILESRAEKMTRDQGRYDAVPHLITERITDLRHAAGTCRALIAGYRL